MARTPLLRALQRLAAEDERREEGGYSRREFLKRAGVTGAAVAVAGPAALAKRASAATAPRIAIVGGGISGLTAALRLADRGIASTVYEASTERVGGRMHTDRSGYFANGQISESCGELIDTGHATIRKLARRFNFDLVDLIDAQPAGTDDTNYILGDYYRTGQATRDFDAIRPTVEDQVRASGYPTTWDGFTDTGFELDHISVYDWIERYVPGGHRAPLGRLLDAAYTGEYGADSRVQSSLNLLYLLGFQPSPKGFEVFGESDERFHIDGGNQQLPEAIADELGPGAIRMGWSMQAIRANADGSVSMDFTTPGRNKTVTADRVILAIPFAVLRKLDYSRARFDTRKKTAITQMGAGVNTKLQLQFASRLWNAQDSTGGGYTDLGIQNTWDVTRGQDGATGILVDYTGGSVAASFATSRPYSNAANNPQVGTFAQQVLAKLNTVYPGLAAQWNGKATLSTPFQDPLLNLSYSYWKVGQYTSFGGYEPVPQGAIHFAGEHCSQDFQGFMEGGAAEGIRAADEVIRAL